MQQVLRTLMWASAGSPVDSSRSAVSMRASRSESCSFIWQPKVRTWKRWAMRIRVYGPALSGSPAVHVTFAAFLVAAAAVSVGSVVQGSVGFGLNLLGAPFIAIVIPQALPATLARVAFPLSLSTVARQHRSVEGPALRWMLVGGVRGTFPGML